MVTTMERPDSINTQSSQENTDLGLFLDGCLIDLKISYWRGRKSLKAQDLDLDPKDVPEIFSLGSKLLIPKRAINQFHSLEVRAHYLIEQFTFPFPTGRAQFVPYSVFQVVTRGLEQIQQEFLDNVTKFGEELNSLREEVIRQFPDQVDALMAGVEAPDKVLKRFKFEWVVYEVQMPRGIRAQALKKAEAIKNAEARAQAVREAEVEFREQFQEQIDGFLSQSVGTLREAVGQTIIGVKDKLDKGEMVTRASLDTVRRAIERFRALNFVGDMDVETTLSDLERAIPVNGKAFDNQDIRDAFTQAVDAVADTIQTSDISSVTGEYRRKLRL